MSYYICAPISKKDLLYESFDDAIQSAMKLSIDNENLAIGIWKGLYLINIVVNNKCYYVEMGSLSWKEFSNQKQQRLDKLIRYYNEYIQTGDEIDEKIIGAINELKMSL